jgi:ubiquinone/menaquinone biosynthesis C-methylase UbiE
MTLADEYTRQFTWRSWPDVVALLPPLSGQTVLDLGCAVGDLAAELAQRGARVIGVDANPELLAVARERRIPNAEFLNADLETLPDVGLVDGIWCSFAAAYFPELGPTLAEWKRLLKPEGWIALTEVDDLFGHEPVEPETRSLLATYVQDALAANRYDFQMGHKLRTHLEQAGFTITHSCTLVDKELSFDGPAEADVLDAWKSRLDRMNLLKTSCGPLFARVRDDFLAALAREDHRATAKVYCCIATR